MTSALPAFFQNRPRLFFLGKFALFFGLLQLVSLLSEPRLPLFIQTELTARPAAWLRERSVLAVRKGLTSALASWVWRFHTGADLVAWLLAWLIFLWPLVYKTVWRIRVKKP